MKIALDIDDTLADSRGSYMKRLFEKYGAPEGMSLAGIVETFDELPRVPFWQKKEIIEWLEQESFSSDAQEKIDLIPGSIEGVKELLKIAEIVCYLTTRPTSAVAGTKIWLDRHGFPELPICNRDDITLNGYEWKSGELKRRYPEIDTIIDNSAELVPFLDNYPGTFLLFSDKNLEISSPRVVQCRTWSDIVGAVKKQQNMI
jgi:hypothetical protein